MEATAPTEKRENKSCCAPAAAHDAPLAPLTPAPASSKPDPTLLPKQVGLPGGDFLMGTDVAEGFAADGEGPVRTVTLSPFAIDVHPVTNASFRSFIAATGYRTEADIYGWSFVFYAHLPKDRFHELVQDTVAAAPWWCKVEGARWDAPEGPGSVLAGRDDHPVVHVSWTDAEAYAAWAGRRLPTEAEWEYAARGGLAQKLYPWGDTLRPKGKHLCNIWQGLFPDRDTAEDGYAGTCPVEAFPPNGYGLYSTTGNTWEWTSDWFAADYHRTSAGKDPHGPDSGTARSMRGGSFLCHKSYCNRYRVAARSSNTPDSSASNIGFRCAF